MSSELQCVINFNIISLT